MAEYKSNYTGQEIDTAIGKANTALQVETDPIFSASASAGIKATDISNWNAKSDFSGSYNDLTDKPTIPSEVTEEIVSDWGFTKNTGDYSKPVTGIPKTDLAEGVQTSLGKADTSVQSSDIANFITKDVNDLTYYELKTATGNSIAMSIDSSTYVLTVSLKNSAGTVLNTQTVDLPLETMVVSGSYDSTNKKIILTLKNGETVEFSVADLVSGLQSEITSSNKLSADLVDDTSTTNKFVTASDKTTWNGKYEKPIAGIPSTDLSSAVQTSLGKADTAIQDISGKEDTTNKVSSITSSSTNIEYAGAKAVWDLVSGASSGIVANELKGSDYYPSAFVFEEKETGVYILSSIAIGNTSNDFYYKRKSTDTNKYLNKIRPLLLIYYKDLKTMSTPSEDTNFATLLAINLSTTTTQQGVYGVYNFYLNSSGNINAQMSVNAGSIITGNNQTINGVKSFNSIPEVVSYTAPTSITQLTAKKYVDDSLSNKLSTSNVKTTASTTQGEVYDVTYINSLVGDINTVLATLTTPSSNVSL